MLRRKLLLLVGKKREDFAAVSVVVDVGQVRPCVVAIVAVASRMLEAESPRRASLQRAECLLDGLPARRVRAIDRVQRVIDGEGC